jgi:hypothetical protein
MGSFAAKPGAGNGGSHKLGSLDFRYNAQGRPEIGGALAEL